MPHTSSNVLRSSPETRPAKRPPALARVISEPAIYRLACAQNQSDFWRRFGTTQSAGSRYETSRAMPRPVQLLLALEIMGIVNHEDLARAGARLDKVPAR